MWTFYTTDSTDLNQVRVFVCVFIWQLHERRAPCTASSAECVQGLEPVLSSSVLWLWPGAACLSVCWSRLEQINIILTGRADPRCASLSPQGGMGGWDRLPHLSHQPFHWFPLQAFLSHLHKNWLIVVIFFVLLFKITPAWQKNKASSGF